MGLVNVDKSHELVRDDIAPAKLISGNGATSLWNAFSDKSEQFHVGHWSSGPCALHVSYDEDELCVIIEGDVKITDNDGQVSTYGKGDAFVIEAGFKGIWESLTKVTKIYAVFEPAAPK
ncbi:MAG: cupin domain-containing protein [Litorimonas sp.]